MLRPPGRPEDSLSVAGVLLVVVEPVEVGLVAEVVPPGAVRLLRAVFAVPVPGGEFGFVVVQQGVTEAKF